jgi:hypothetical protein
VRLGPASGEVSAIQILDSQLRQNCALQELLSRYGEIDLPDAWIAAGSIAQTVWNLSAGQPAEFGIKDVDIIYFDPANLSADAEAAHERRLCSLFSNLAIVLDVKNQARVHLWYESKFGYPIAAYRSSAGAIATFPTTATAIGVRPEEGALECCAPFGLEDLFELTVRANRRQITQAIYEEKVERWRRLWPHLTFLDWSAS